jgi:hypothetical protein
MGNGCSNKGTIKDEENNQVKTNSSTTNPRINDDTDYRV